MNKAKDQHPWFGKWYYDCIYVHHILPKGTQFVRETLCIFTLMMQHRHWTRVHSSGPGWSPLWMAQEWFSWAPGLWNSLVEHPPQKMQMLSVDAIRIVIILLFYFFVCVLCILSYLLSLLNLLSLLAAIQLMYVIGSKQTCWTFIFLQGPYYCAVGAGNVSLLILIIMLILKESIHMIMVEVVNNL